MMRTMKWILLSLILVSSSHALAEEDEDKQDRKVVYRQKTEIDFEGLDVEATLVKPQGSLVIERKKASFNPLIKVRENWQQEIDQSTDEIK